jgi:Fur family ferric uptake transcriptional regulator
MEQEKKITKDFVISSLKKKKMKITSQRKAIIETFLELGGHVSVEDIFYELRKRKKNIGLATIYRTLSMLKEAGLVSERDFRDGRTRFEIVSEHHDHIICQKCGKVVEFRDETIEKLQEEISKRLGFVLISHRHELMGICEDCRKSM